MRMGFIILCISFIQLYGAESGSLMLHKSVSSITASDTIEKIYKEHMEGLCRNIATDKKCGQAQNSLMVQFIPSLALRSFSSVLKLVQQDLKVVTQNNDINNLFVYACKQVEQQENLEKRMIYWLNFVQSVYQYQAIMQSKQLPDLIIPNKNDAVDVMQCNKFLFFPLSKQQSFMIHRVLTFLPMALIEQHDPEAFQVFLEARNQ